MSRQIVSDQFALPIRNLARDIDTWLSTGATGWSPQWFGNGGGAGTTGVVQNAGPNGCGVFRKTWTTAPTLGGQDVGVSFAFNTPFVAGQTYTFLASCMATWATEHTLDVLWQNSSGQTIGSAVRIGNRAITTAGQRAQLRGTAVAPAGTVGAKIVWGPYPASGTSKPVVGDTFDAYKPMAVEGVYTGDYCTALLAGSGWTRLVDGTSAGYLWTLSGALGGLTSYLNESPGVAMTIPAPAAMVPRTLFSVFDTTGTLTVGYNNIAAYGQDGKGQVVIQLGNVGESQTRARVDLQGGAYNRNMVADNAGRTAGRHINSARVDSTRSDGLLNRLSVRAQGAPQPTVYPADLEYGTGFQPTAHALLLGPSYGQPTEGVPQAAVLTVGNVTEAQELNVHRWLANRYGVVLAS